MDIGTLNPFQTAATRLGGVAEGARPQEAGEARETGRIGGFQVQTEVDLTSLLEDSMEEVSQMFEEDSVKELADWEMGEERADEKRFDAKMQFWNEKFPDMPDAEQVKMLRRLLRNAGGMQLSEFLYQLRKFSSDVSHQFAALDILEEMLEGRPEEAEQAAGAQKGSGEQARRPEDAAALALVRQARASLEKTDGAAIRVGINLAEALKQSGEPPERLQQMRDLYRSEILGFTTPQECYRSLVARGDGSLSKALDFLLQSCQVDMEAATPSTPPEELRRIILDLQCVNVLRFVVERFDRLGVRMANEFQQPLNLTGETITGRVLDLTELNFIDAQAMAQFAGECGVAKLLAKLDFMRESSAIFRSLSGRLFRDDESRLRMLDAAQEYLDELVREDEKEREKQKNDG